MLDMHNLVLGAILLVIAIGGWLVLDKLTKILDALIEIAEILREVESENDDE
jgi:hypothetical protein